MSYFVVGKHYFPTGVCRVSDAHLFSWQAYPHDMRSDDGDEELEAVEVALPRDMLVDIDRLAVFYGYETPSAVVREALDRQ